jgi:transposase
LSNDKYDCAFKAHLCMLKYYLGLPFYRIQAYQRAVGIPLPDSTQWQLVEQLADCVYPVFGALEKLAACGHLVHVDDTTVRILSAIKENKTLLNRKDRKGTFTTGVLSYYQQHKIYLFYSSRKHAGENMLDVLSQRNPHLPPIQYMCDALSRNMPEALKAILINCLSHARRKFVEIESFYVEECGYVINALAQVYHHDAVAKEQTLPAAQRLAFHQQHSSPIMDGLYHWLKKQLNDNLVEPNGGLGSAIRYFLNHWERFTQFLKIAGAPLDNNIIEAGLKIPIRIRKNAMFFATEHGAFVGSMILSLIQTCIVANENPIEYLTTLQENKSQIFKEPDRWLPWNYKGTILPQVKAAA